jgi:pyrroloquinoline quinone (PQQ) biosynthesis protein C
MPVAFFDRLQQETQQDRQELFSLPIIQRALQGQINLEQYIAFLSQAFHHVKHTVPLLIACGSRLGHQYEWLRKALAEYIEEEIGHEEWILSDIEICGGSPELVRHASPNLATESMVAYAYHQIDRLNPVGFFGMVYVLEGTSTALATNAANVIKKSLNLPTGAFSYLTSHGSLDLEHLRFFENIMNQLTEEADKATVIYCAKRFYALYGDIFKSLPNFNC